MQSNEFIIPEREPRFKALIPFIVFLIFYFGLSMIADICYHLDMPFYAVKMPIAFLVASATALMLDHKQKLSDKIEVYARGMGDSNIMIMCLIFILAGMFAKVAKEMGAVDAAVLISRHLLPDHLMLVGFFLVSCFISLAIGTSCGTIIALVPIAAELVGPLQLSPVLMIGTVVGGAMFGDNMSMISDTTIAATRTLGVNMRDKFLMNMRMIFPAAIVAIIIYVALGFFSVSPKIPAATTEKTVVAAQKVNTEAEKAEAAKTGATEKTVVAAQKANTEAEKAEAAKTGATEKQEVKNKSGEIAPVTWSHILKIVPYIAILLCALIGMNVMSLLFFGTAIAMIIGIWTKSFTFMDAFLHAGNGSISMAETLIVAILAGGLLSVIRHNGGVSYLLLKIESAIHGRRSCELGMVLITAVVNIFTANNTVAIVISGPIARDLSSKYDCDRRRSASILDSTSCVIQGLIPYGAQILIAVDLANKHGATLSAPGLIGSLYYPMLLGLALIVSIIITRDTVKK